MAIDVKQAHRRLLEEVFNRGNFQAFDEVCDPSYQSHDPVTGDADLESGKSNLRMWKSVFPDLRMEILDCHADGEHVTTRWRCTGTHQRQFMGLAPTGRKVTVEGISLARFRNGKLVEDFVQWDAYGMLCQLGVILAMREEAREEEAQEEHHPHA